MEVFRIHSIWSVQCFGADEPAAFFPVIDRVPEVTRKYTVPGTLMINVAPVKLGGFHHSAR